MSYDSRIKEGELMKYRNMLYGWKKYYFKLERSYLHYFEGKYTSEPKGTITRGEISRLKFSKELRLNGFEIHMNSGDVWHLKAASHEERMEWMRALQPEAYIVDPMVNSESSVCEQSQPSLPPEHQAYQSTMVEPIHSQLYPHLQTSNATQEGSMSGPPYTPPPAYDEINYTQ